MVIQLNCQILQEGGTYKYRQRTELLSQGGQFLNTEKVAILFLFIHYLEQNSQILVRSVTVPSVTCSFKGAMGSDS